METNMTEYQAFGNTTGAVLQHIVNGLNTGRYRPGDRLNAASLCSDLQLSKAPVREALHVLAGEGVIDMVRNRGALIRRLSTDDLLLLWEAFALSIGREIRLAAQSVSEKSKANAVLTSMARISGMKSSGAGIGLLRCIHDFHDAVSALNYNPFIVPPSFRRVSEFWLPYIVMSVPLDLYVNNYVANYQRICDALLAGDGQTAESAFHYHARWSAAVIRGEAAPPNEPWSPERSTIPTI